MKLVGYLLRLGGALGVLGVPFIAAHTTPPQHTTIAAADQIDAAMCAVPSEPEQILFIGCSGYF